MPWHDDRDEEKLRRCLRCGKMFMSVNCGHRVCPECTLRPFDIPSPLVINMTDVEAMTDELWRDCEES